MMPYLQADLDAGRLTEESALELLEEFFLTFNPVSYTHLDVYKRQLSLP